MLLEEARVAAFITVATRRGSAAKLVQDGARAHHGLWWPVLISWTGTMFEYLMPSLWMHSYPDTLVSRTLAGRWKSSAPSPANTTSLGHLRIRLRQQKR